MQIRIHPSLYIYLICTAILSSFQTCLALLLALLVHEAGHFAACRLIGEQIELLELTPWGGIMTRKRGTPAHKGIKGVCVHAAGPLSNYAILLLSGSAAILRALEPTLIRSIVVTNASMLLINSIPVLPLDGGHIVFSIGYYFFPVSTLVSVLSALGVMAGVGGFLLALYGFAVRSILNCSLVIISIHLIISAKRTSNMLLTENLWTVVQERMLNSFQIRKAEHYRVSGEVLLYELIPLLRHTTRHISFSFSCDGEECVFEEEAFCRSLLESPSISIAQAYANWPRIQRK